MPSVFVMQHQGVSCAVPAAQVVTVMSRHDAVERLELWPDAHSRPPERLLHVRTKTREFCLGCSEPRLAQLAARDAFPLPAIVQRELQRQFVVGLARAGSDWIWLIDLELV